MNMELITSAASDALVNVVLAIIALAGAYGVYYIRLGATKLKEQTAQIKDEAGRLIGMLCVNFDPAHCVQAANAVLALCGLPGMSLQTGEDAGASAGAETFVGSVPDAVRSAIEEVTGATGVPASRLTMEEKIRIVDALNQGGLFYLKGAVSEVAAQLGSSEATVYRYLSKLKN